MEKSSNHKNNSALLYLRHSFQPVHPPNLYTTHHRPSQDLNYSKLHTATSIQRAYNSSNLLPYYIYRKDPHITTVGT
eukprot:13106926-Ditylum_brightwellii.AAC.1